MLFSIALVLRITRIMAIFISVSGIFVLLILTKLWGEVALFLMGEGQNFLSPRGVLSLRLLCQEKCFFFH
jgi:hypothetical protein